MLGLERDQAKRIVADIPVGAISFLFSVMLGFVLGFLRLCFGGLNKYCFYF